MSSTHVLTAAHCLFHPTLDTVASGVSVYVGDATTPVFPSHFHVHANYSATAALDSVTYRSDVAVLSFTAAFQDVRVMALADAAIAAEMSGSALVYAAGFGQTSSLSSFSPTLLRTRLRTQAHATCAAEQPAALRALTGADDVVCGTDPAFPGNGGRDTCNGDSGGPLYWFRANGTSPRLVQVGITSWSRPGCAGARRVAWYARVESFAMQVRDLVSAEQGGVAVGSGTWTRRP